MFIHNIHIHIQVSGKAVNYLVSVPGPRGCLEACEEDQRCCNYSYHQSKPGHPDHATCYLFRFGECDMEDLMYMCDCGKALVNDVLTIV